MTDLICPVIIMRHGGLDGVALQQGEYFSLLSRLDMGMSVVSGRDDGEQPAPLGCEVTIVDRLDFYHPDSQLLFANQFTEGPEKADVAEIGKQEWLELFERHRGLIREAVAEVLERTANNTPVLVYNLLSLRHAHPAAAVAIHDLIERYPNRGFLSHSADPDAERPEKTSRIHPWALEKISAVEASRPYDGGPYQRSNLYHIVLNQTQRAGFVLKYGVDSEHVYEIPDFLAFASDEPVIADRPGQGFLEQISERAVFSGPDGPAYRRAEIDAETVFWLSPVRPVYRKRLQEAMLIAHCYGRQRNERVAFVVTHPDIDDPSYFATTVRYAEDLGLTYLHLAEDTQPGLDRVYRSMAPLRTVGIIASSAGGWENALNEMARACIPFVMNSGLNSYRPLTDQIGVRTFGMSFVFLQGLVPARPASELANQNLSVAPSMTPLLRWVDQALAPETRRELVVHNYRQARRHLSYRPTTLRLWEAILKIYAQHGLPGPPSAGAKP